MNVRQYYRAKNHNQGINWTGLLDGYETNIYRAYGFVRYFTAYSGPCIRVSTSEDTTILGTETDINFNSNGIIDESQLLSFAAGGSLYIHTFYDLSNNTRDSTASTATLYRRRARIVNSGVIETFNTKPSAFFHLSAIAYDFLGLMLPELTDSTVIYIHDLVRTALHIKLGEPTGGLKFGYVSTDGSTNTFITSTTVLPGNTLRANKAAFVGTNRNDVHDFLTGQKIVSEFGFQITAGNGNGWHFANYGGSAQGAFLNGSLPNMLLWDADLGTTAIDAISDLLNSYYSVY